MSNNMVTADSKRIDWMITLVPFILIMALAVYLFIFPEQANGVISQVRFFFGDTVGLYYLVIGVGVLLVSLFLSFSKYGDIVLGEPDEKPQYNFFTWGSMMFTCGLSNVGPLQQMPDGKTQPQHGFIRNTPAEHCGARTYWIGDDYYLELTGTMRESSLFGTNLVLRRTITTKLGDPAVEIRDEIENESSTENVPCMLMYHCNAGLPLIDACSVFEIDPVESGDRDEIAANGRKEESYKVFGDPIVGYDEQVFYHKLPADENGWCHATMVNPERKLALTVSYHNQELPYLIHWKCKDAGNYVTGIAPAHCHPEGGHKEAENGTLRRLAAHETITTGIIIRAGER